VSKRAWHRVRHEKHSLRVWFEQAHCKVYAVRVQFVCTSRVCCRVWRDSMCRVGQNHIFTKMYIQYF